MTARPEWTDRLSGTVGEPVHHESLSGQLILTGASTPVYLNDPLAVIGDYLVPGSANQWSVWRHEGGPDNGSFVTDPLPDRLTNSGVLEVAQRLATLGDVSRWLEIPPLIQDLSERLDPQTLEQQANADMDQLRS